jgi:hypothetical protein
VPDETLGSLDRRVWTHDDSGTPEAMRGERAFAIDSNVGRYWLARGQGFDVVAERGQRVGVVKDLVVDPQTLEVSEVVVRRRPTAWARRPARVQVAELRAVLPGSRRFVLTPREAPARTHVWAAVARRQAATAAQRTGHVSAVAARHTGRASSVAARHTGRAVARGTAAVAAQTRARWPTVRHALAVGTVRTRHALGVAAVWARRALETAATHTASFMHRSWRAGSTRVRESALYARARARRAR